MTTDAAIRAGYYLAVANLMRLHDEPTLALELLMEFGPVNLDYIDEADREVLLELICD